MAGQLPQAKEKPLEASSCLIKDNQSQGSPLHEHHQYVFFLVAKNNIPIGAIMEKDSKRGKLKEFFRLKMRFHRIMYCIICKIGIICCVNESIKIPVQ